MSAAKKLPAVGYSDDTAPRILAYLISMKPLEGCTLDGKDGHHRGRSLIERLAMSASGEDSPKMRLTPAQCVDVLQFMMFSEPVAPDSWWTDPKDAPSHVVGYYFVLGALKDGVRAPT